jgi:hypothetical protein
MTQLSSGRLLCAIDERLRAEWDRSYQKVIGRLNGYAIWSTNFHHVLRNRLFIVYSDDNGKTWNGFDKPIDSSPLIWCELNKPFIERSDGTITVPIWGFLSAKDDNERRDAGGLLRSTDGGKTWGDFSLIAYDKDHPWTVAYNEAVIAPVREDLWVAFMRTEFRGVGNESGWTSRAISTDGGYT